MPRVKQWPTAGEPEPEEELEEGNDIEAIKKSGKGLIELPHTGGYFIVTYSDQNRVRFGVLYNPEGEPIAIK